MNTLFLNLICSFVTESQTTNKGGNTTQPSDIISERVFYKLSETQGLTVDGSVITRLSNQTFVFMRLIEISNVPEGTSRV